MAWTCFLELSLKIVGTISAQFILVQVNFLDKYNNNKAKTINVTYYLRNFAWKHLKTLY